MWYLIVFFISMVPIVEIRGAVPVAVANDLNLFWTYVICILGNMLPVPIIYLFARKVLVWGSDKKFIGRFFSFCLEKGEKGGRKLVEILVLRYGLDNQKPLTQREVAQRLNISRSYVSRIEKSVLTAIRRAVQPEENGKKQRSRSTIK